MTELNAYILLWFPWVGFEETFPRNYAFSTTFEELEVFDGGDVMLIAQSPRCFRPCNHLASTQPISEHARICTKIYVQSKYAITIVENKIAKIFYFMHVKKAKIMLAAFN